jgi:hypothetical protein
MTQWIATYLSGIWYVRPAGAEPPPEPEAPVMQFNAAANSQLLAALDDF